MSLTQISLHAYDVLDQVQVILRVSQEEEGSLPVHEWETLVATRIQSTGEADAREWAKDALVAAIEAL